MKDAALLRDGDAAGGRDLLREGDERAGGGGYPDGGLSVGQAGVGTGPDVFAAGPGCEGSDEGPELAFDGFEALGEEGELDVEAKCWAWLLVLAAGVGAELECFEGKGGVREGVAGAVESGEIVGEDGPGAGGFWDGVEAEGDLCDEAEGAEGAGHEFVEVVAGHIFDDFAAGFGDGAVGEDDGHADDEVAEGAVAGAEGAAVVGGDDAADGGGFRRDGVEGDGLAVDGERALEVRPGGAGSDGGGEVQPDMLADAVEGGGGESEVRGGGLGPGGLGPGAEDADAEAVLIGEREEFSGVGGGGGGGDRDGAVSQGDLRGRQEGREGVEMG